jgi:hypothetical protein
MKKDISDLFGISLKKEFAQIVGGLVLWPIHVQFAKWRLESLMFEPDYLNEKHLQRNGENFQNGLI